MKVEDGAVATPRNAGDTMSSAKADVKGEPEGEHAEGPKKKIKSEAKSEDERKAQVAQEEMMGESAKRKAKERKGYAPNKRRPLGQTMAADFF